jgi:hypothetical protein
VLELAMLSATVLSLLACAAIPDTLVRIIP